MTLFELLSKFQDKDMECVVCTEGYDGYAYPKVEMGEIPTIEEVLDSPDVSSKVIEYTVEENSAGYLWFVVTIS